MAGLDDFKKLEIKIARIKGVEDHPNADKLYVLKIDIGQEERQIIAGIKGSYKANELPGLKIAVITNLQPAVIRGVESQGMLLAAQDENGISILTPHRPVATGSIVR